MIMWFTILSIHWRFVNFFDQTDQSNKNTIILRNHHRQ
jgi:hypothetical protein